MFGISFPELVVIGIVILIVVGPEKLPSLAHTVGKLMGQLKRNSDELRKEFYNSAYKPIEEAQLAIKSAKRELRSVRDEAVKEILSPSPEPKDPLCPDATKAEVSPSKNEPTP